MHHYLVSALQGKRGKPDGLVAPRDAAIMDSEAASNARLRTEEQTQEVLQERQRAYSDFMTRTRLGRLLADHMPTAEMNTAPATASSVSQAPVALDTEAVGTGVSLATGGERPLSVETGLAHTKLELAMNEALTPLLSRRTIIMTRRVLVLVPESATASPKAAPGGQACTAFTAPPHSSRQKSFITLEEATEAQLPFLLVLVQLRRWQACLTSLSMALCSEAAARNENAAIAPVRVVKALQQLSHVLVAMTCAAELQTATMRRHLDLLSGEVALCVATTLQCLRRLTRAYGTEEFSLLSDRAPAGSAPAAQSIPRESNDAVGGGDSRDGTGTPHPVPAEVVEIQACRLLSLLLYWVHMIHDISFPCLAIEELFLTSSTARFNTYTATVEAEKEATAGAAEAEEAPRCTGLSNAALLYQTNVMPFCTPLTMLSMSASDTSGSSEGDKSPGIGSLTPPTSTSDVASSLIALLLFASKGAIENAQSSTEGHTVMAEGHAVEEDSDLGLIFVLTSRLLRYMFAASASPHLVQMTKAAGPLQSALIILLARFIAEDRNQSNLRSHPEKATASQSASLPSCDVHEHVHADSDFSFPRSSLASASQSSLPTRSCRSSKNPVPFEQSGRPTRQLRLLGQLSCGLVLLTMLLQQNATIVLDIMDHSFFFDALVTALQVVGSRFTETSNQGAAAVRVLEAAGRRNSEAWADWVRDVETLAAQGTAAEDMLVIPNHALACPLPFSLTRLSNDPYVDEFLHAYLGLLAACRVVRSTPSTFLASPPGGMLVGRSGAITATSSALVRESRALDTLDQLELTLVKTFFSACDTVAEGAASAAAAAVRGLSTLPTPPGQHSVHSETIYACEDNRDLGDAGSLVFPFGSCIYNLLLKHAIWCLGEQERRRAQPLPPPPPPPLTPPQASLPQQQHYPTSPLLQLSAPFAMPHLPTNTSASTVTNTPRLHVQALTTHASVSPSVSPSIITPANMQQSGATTLPWLSGCATVTDTRSSDDDPFVLFLVRHGLFRILLHDEHFASAFTLSERTAAVDTADFPRGHSFDEEVRDRSNTTWQRAYLVLYILSHCLLLRPCDAPSSDSEQSARRVSVEEGDASVDPNVLHHRVCTHNSSNTSLSANEKQLAQETVKALMAVLRVASASVSPPCGAAVRGRRRRWYNCLLALLTSATTAPGTASFTPHHVGEQLRAGTEIDTPGVARARTTAAAAAAVCEALVRAEGVEHLLRTATVAADAAAAGQQTNTVSYTWVMQVVRSVARDSTASVHMATNCAKSLLLPLLWHPLLRSDGQRLLEALLCQPLLPLGTTVDTYVDIGELSLSTVSSTGNAGSDSSAADVHAVPLHCRRLCEGVWRTLCDCVYGSAAGSSDTEMPDAIISGTRAFSVRNTEKGERQAVLRTVLEALETAFRTLSGRGFSECGEHSGELLPLRTLQRALFEASRDDGRHIYELLLDQLGQSWRKTDNSGALSRPPPLNKACGAEVALSPSSPVSFLLEASDTHSALDSSPAQATETEGDTVAACRTAREMVRLVIIALVGMTLANASQRAILYGTTIDEEALVNCIVNAWGTAGGNGTLPFSRLMGEEDVCGMVRVYSYLIYESVDAVEAFFADDNDNGSQAAARQRGSSRHGASWACSLQNPVLLAALLRWFTRLTSLTEDQQAALRKLLVFLIRTVQRCCTSLYLAASSAVHDALTQLLPVVALLPEPAAPRFSSSLEGEATLPRLDAVLVHLLAALTHCYIDARQLKQLLMLVIHSRYTRDRRVLVPLVLQVLSEAVQSPLNMKSFHRVRRDPQHFVALLRGHGPAGLCAALPDFPLEGYSVSLNVRWEGDVTLWDVAGKTVGEDARLRQYNDCACIFSLRTTDQATLLAFMVERCTGRLFVQYRNLQQQELRVYLAASLPPREWTHLCLSHRAAALLTATAGGELTLFVNDAEAAVIPQVAYPLMLRGHLYIGCLGHEVERASVTHAFYGQVATVYFFPYVLPKRDRQILQTAAGVTDTAAWMLSPSTLTIPPLRSGPYASGRRSDSSAPESTLDVDSAQQWLAGRAVVCIDTRMSDRGHLYNLAAVLRGRTGCESQLLTMEGTVVCSTQRLIDSMGMVGALPSVLMPLCVLLVNPNLPISSRGLVSAPQIGSLAHRESCLPPFSSLDVADSAAAVSASKTSDTINTSVLRVLDLVPWLASSEAIRSAMAEVGFFVFLGQVLQLLGPSLQVGVPVAFVPLLEALAPFPRLFEDALANLFLSSDVIRAAPRAVQLTWVKVQRFFLNAHPDALPCLRTLGTSMLVAAELLCVTAEEASDRELAPECPPVPATTKDIVTHPLLVYSPSTPRPVAVVSSDLAGVSSSATISPFLPPSTSPPPSTSCSLQDLESQWMTYFEALTVAPATLADAEALQYFVGNLHLTCSRDSVQLRLLRRVRQLLVTSPTPYLVQLLGRRNYVVSLMPYLTSTSSEAVRLEALLQLLFMVLRSKRTQELMNPLLLASKDAIVHVVEEVSLSWLKDALQPFPVNLPVYLTLRCGLLEQFDMPTIPTQYTPLDESHTIRFAAVLLPLLMLMRHSSDTKLKEYVLADMAVLLKSDTQAWRRVITVRGWYVSVIGLLASSCASSPISAPSSLQEAHVCQESSVPGALSSPTIPANSAASERAQPEGHRHTFTTISMILSHTIYQVLLHEAYGTTELELVVAYLREQRLHCLLHQVLCMIADLYRRRLTTPWRGERRGSTDEGERPGAPRPLSACAFLGLGSATAVVNLCHFLRVVEVVLFYTGLGVRWKEAILPPTQSTVSPLTPAGAASGGEEFGTHLPVRVGYTEWDQLMLVRSGNSPPGSVSEGEVYYAREVDDPHGNVRRDILCSPDERWLHLPLAVKCAELLCSHSALLHLGSNGNTTSLSVGGAGSVVRSGTAGSGGPGDLLWSVVLGASASTGVKNSPTNLTPDGAGGVEVGAGGWGGAPVVLRGGMLRLFGRLFKVICQMTLRSGTALSSVVELTDAFVRCVDQGQRGSSFLSFRRAVNAEDAREHSPIATTMTLIYCVHNLILRRLHAAEYGNTSRHPNANAVLVDRLKSLVVMFRYSFEQLPAFTSSPRRRGVVQPSVFRHSSLLAAAAWFTHGDREDSAGDRSGGRNSASSLARPNSTYLDALTGEVLTAGVPTLQWLCDHQANQRRTVEAFAEVASRVDYNAFVERCLLAVEREQSTDKSLAAKLWSEHQTSLRRLQELFTENSVSRRLVHDKIQKLRATLNSHKMTGAADETDRNTVTAQLEGHRSAQADGFATSSSTSLFLPSAARRATTAARAKMWARFTVALRGTVWCADVACLHNTLKYVKLSSQEQQFLLHRKLVYDRDGTNYSGKAMTSYSVPSSPLSDDLSSANVTSFRARSVLRGDEVESGGSLAFGGSMSANTSHASYLRLRGGETVLLQAIDDDDIGLEEDMLSFSLDGRMDVSTAAEASLSECTLLREESAPVSKGACPALTSKADDFCTASSLLSVPCEVPYMMHCWSGSFTARGSEVIVLIDDDNKAYNQVVAEEARAYVLRPRPFRFHLSDITQIAPARRFRMRRTALEIWTRDRRSYFVNFADTATMKAALQAMRCGERSSYMLMAPSFLRDASGMATAVLPALLYEGNGGASRHRAYVLQENPRREPLRLRATVLWRSRLLSNFDYLLVLNLLAGRTLNDMTQYPVFPWILSDYTSEKLDLTDPETFRDLSMPMGAWGNRDRREQVRQRYMEMRNLGDVPSHYFTHYSSPAITLYFLVRLPPFTTLSILLQGGHFDHADRMFHSMQATFRAVMTSTQDVRELIPELYYLPELCINANHIDFGRRQDRTPMDDLQLPPWAHNDPFTFVYRMREALECAHVSAHLHEWIDLIFGYKQRGKDAIDALNVFNWYSYEELGRSREVSSIDQQLLVDSLDNIGQTPIQLFRRPHQPRLPLEWADPLQLPIQVKAMPLRWGCARVARTMVVSTDRVLVVSGSGAAVSLRMHLTPIRQSSVPQRAVATSPGASVPAATASQVQGASVGGGIAASTPSQDEVSVTDTSSHVNATAAVVPGDRATPAAMTPALDHSALPATDSGSFDISEEYEWLLPPIPAGAIPNYSAYTDGSCTEDSTALLCYDNEVFLVLGGLFDNSVVIRALSSKRDDVRLRAHRGRVLFVARSEDSHYLVTGAEDTTFAVWSCELQPSRQQLEVTPLFTIYGHEDLPSAVDVSSVLDVVATASLKGTLMLHSLSTGELDRVIRHPYGAPIHRVLLQTVCYVPNVVFLSHEDEKVYQYSLNGAALRTFSPPGRVEAWVTTASQCLLLACQPLNSVHDGGSASAPGCAVHDDDQKSCILYLHSFFLEVLKTVPVRAEDVVSSVSVHPCNPQIVVAGTESGRLLLLRSVLV